MDYILGMDHCLFRNVYVWDPGHNSDNYMILGCLCSSTLREHTKYLRRRTWLPLRSLTTPMREGGIFAVLWRAIPKPKACKSRKNAWILEAAWRFVNTRVSASQNHVWYQYPICILSCLINAILEADQQWRTEEAGGETEGLLASSPPLHKETWHSMKGWYKATHDRAPPPD